MRTTAGMGDDLDDDTAASEDAGEDADDAARSMMLTTWSGDNATASTPEATGLNDIE